MIVYIWFLLCVILFEISQATICIKNVTSPIQHAEGPHWDFKKQILYFVDTFQATALHWNPRKNVITSFKVEDRDSIGIIIPIKDEDNAFVIGADRYIYKAIWNETNNNAVHLKKLLMVDESKPYNQFNDGKVDKRGNLWIGTLTRNKDLSVTNFGGELFVITGTPALRANWRILDRSISNGLAWSKDNNYFYYIDSEDRNVKKYRFILNTAAIYDKKIIFDFSNYPDIKGVPDGMTIDSEDNLWIAVYGGGCILKVDSSTGQLLQTIKMPVTYVTSVAFGGTNLDKLYATTSRQKLNTLEVQQQPMAGSVFEISNLGVKGLPANDFKYRSN